MNNTQKAILNIMQDGIPICSRPYKAIAEQLGLSEDLVYKEYMALEAQGLIRRYGGIVDINKLGIVSTLIGVQVEPNHIESVANFISQFEGVTHNYQRDDLYNLWFTLMASSQREIEETINHLSSQSGVVDIINLPSKQKFKTKVVFKF